MSSLETVHRFMEIFYSGNDIEKLRPLLAEDLVFEARFIGQIRRLRIYKFSPAVTAAGNDL